MSSIASGMKHISRYEAPIWCVWNIDFIKWVNFNWVLKYVPIKLEQISGNFLKLRQWDNFQPTIFHQNGLYSIASWSKFNLKIHVFEKFKSQITLYWWRHNHEMKSKTKYFDFIIIFKLNLKAPNKIPGWYQSNFSIIWKIWKISRFVCVNFKRP